MTEFTNGGKDESEEFFSFHLSLVRMVIECAFGRLKARFGCLMREMDVNIRELPDLINSCFVVNIFCDDGKEPLNQKHLVLH